MSFADNGEKENSNDKHQYKTKENFYIGINSGITLSGALIFFDGASVGYSYGNIKVGLEGSYLRTSSPSLTKTINAYYYFDNEDDTPYVGVGIGTMVFIGSRGEDILCYAYHGKVGMNFRVSNILNALITFKFTSPVDQSVVPAAMQEPSLIQIFSSLEIGLTFDFLSYYR
ncbi:hypothetical protein [Wolbachia endosymbiont of Ctenocephalides felis wCfeT]|uniref:hypothetical protein n=1 Tax=Wolbachia endosymbiont of Ctenocephalides felis wCfeT TaxID=2732593 RepID=UPI0014464908|nr:hypothetical protein [Wolbachia endosymbiont of Ctenocephalides felis wCfeT]